MADTCHQCGCGAVEAADGHAGESMVGAVAPRWVSRVPRVAASAEQRPAVHLEPTRGARRTGRP